MVQGPGEQGGPQLTTFFGTHEAFFQRPEVHRPKSFIPLAQSGVAGPCLPPRAPVARPSYAAFLWLPLPSTASQQTPFKTPAHFPSA